MTLWSPDLAKSHEKGKPLYLHDQSLYGHQIRQDGKLPWWALIYILTWPFDLARPRDKLKALYLYYHNTSDFGKVVIYDEELPLKKYYMILQSYDFVRSGNVLNTLYLHLHSTNDHQTWESGDYKMWGASTHKFK